MRIGHLGGLLPQYGHLLDFGTLDRCFVGQTLTNRLVLFRIMLIMSYTIQIEVLEVEN